MKAAHKSSQAAVLARLSPRNSVNES